MHTAARLAERFRSGADGCGRLGRSRWTVAVAAHDVDGTQPLRPPPSSWPFQLVSSDRIEALRRHLGPKKGQEAIRDIDKYLDVLVSKWEQEASGAKRRAGPP